MRCFARKAPHFNWFLSGLWCGLRIDIGTTELRFKLPQIIAIRTFVDLFLRVEVDNYAMWLVMISQWSLIGAIVIAGPATAKIEKHGPFCE